MSGPYWLQIQPLSRLKSHPLIINAYPLSRLEDPAYFQFHAHPLGQFVLHNGLVSLRYLGYGTSS